MKNKIIVMVSNTIGQALLDNILKAICIENKVVSNFDVVTIKSNMQTYRKSIKNYYITNIQSDNEIDSIIRCLILFELDPTNIELKQCNQNQIKQDLESLGADVSIIKIEGNFENLIFLDIERVLKFLKLDKSLIQEKNLNPFQAIKYLFSEAGLEYSYNDTETINRLVKEINVKKLIPSICPDISLICMSLGICCKNCLSKQTIPLGA